MDRFRHVNFHRKGIFSVYLGIGLAFGCSESKKLGEKSDPLMDTTEPYLMSV